MLCRHTDRTMIFTTEPEANRALGAELRACPEETRQFFSSRLDIELGLLTEVAMERSHIDLVVRFGDVEVGIETKIGHIVTLEQLEREKSKVQHLVLIVEHLNDITIELPEGVVPTTWGDILPIFPNARLTLSDIELLSAKSSLRTRRIFQELARNHVSADVKVWEESGSAGRTSLMVATSRSPQLGGSYIFGQVESADRGKSNDYVATIGISLSESDLDDSDSPPAWIEALMRCGPLVESLAARGDRDENRPQIRISQHRGVASTPRGPNLRYVLANRHGLPTRFAKGYSDSYVGFKTVRTEHVAVLAEEAISWIRAMWDELEDAEHSGTEDD